MERRLGISVGRRERHVALTCSLVGEWTEWLGEVVVFGLGLGEDGDMLEWDYASMTQRVRCKNECKPMCSDYICMRSN